MNKRYEIFISSTYDDLKEERQKVIKALIEMDCIPSGMELFPAADEEQWEFIKKAIDNCDYYLLIIGGRYGSVTNDGISYTEKEFNYAVEKKIHIIALIHGNIDNIPSSKSENKPKQKKKLLNFIQKVKKGRLVKPWNTLDELSALIFSNVNKAIQLYPAVGWVKADQVANTELLTEINELRKENKELRKTLDEFKEQEKFLVEDIADLDSKFTLHFVDVIDSRFEVEFTWRDIFLIISPYISLSNSLEKIKSYFSKNISQRQGLRGTFKVNDEDFQTIGIQLMVYRLITIDDVMQTWELTNKGKRLMIEHRVIRKDKLIEK